MKKKSGQYLIRILFLLVGAACGLIASFYQIGFLVLFLSMLAALFLQIIIHELGHLVCGLISGYRFSSFRIGSLMLIKKPNGMKLKRFSLMGTGGQCLMEPPEQKHDQIPYKLYNFGGVLWNLIASCVFFAFFLMPTHSSECSVFTLLATIIGIAFALTNGIPMHLMVDNDGYNALNLGKSSEALRAFWLQLKINAMLTNGVRLKDMPDEWFVLPSEEALKNGLSATIGVLSCNRAMDQLNFQLASDLARVMLETDTGILTVHRFMLISECMFCELIGENRPERLQEARTKEFLKYEKNMKNYPSLLRTQYAYELLAKGDEEAANKKLSRFEMIAKSYPYESEIIGERELLAYVKQCYAKKESFHAH
jgi:hypothetical protein